MPLPNDPSFTAGTTGNILSARPLAAAANVTFTFNVSNVLYGQLQVLNLGPATVSSTTGVTLQVYRTVDGTNYDTVVYGGINILIPTVAATQESSSYDLGPGLYLGKLTNVDAAYQTTVTVTLGGVG